jgi:hypothetical protein
MKLYLCDYHLEAGRLCLAEEKNKQAEHHFSTAREMIRETGYFRRREETQKRRNEETKRKEKLKKKEILHQLPDLE